MTRNYRVVGLVSHGDHSTVEIERACRRHGAGCACRGARRVRVDTGVPASGWGDFGLSRVERGIVRRGLTAAGRDRRPR